MKYINTRVKINRILLLLFATITTGLYSQNTTDSPYSRYGIGLITPTSFNGNFGLAGAGIAWRPYSYKPLINDSLAKTNSNLIDRKTNYINPANPASTSNISLTTFEASMLSSFVSYTSENQKLGANNVYFNHLALAFPIKDWWGAGFGLRPYSLVGYEYTNSTITTNGEQVDFAYSGGGGANQFYISNAFEIKKALSVGFNASYIFGNVSHEERVIYNDLPNAFNSMRVREYAIGDFLFDLGLQYYWDYKEYYRFTFGATASIDDRMEARSSNLIRNYTGREGFERYRDTIAFFDDRDIEIDFPVHYGAGLAFEKKGEWLVMADYKLRKWSTDLHRSDVTMNNGHLISLGYENLAEYNGIGSYIKRLGYRVGAHYNTSILNINGEDIPEYGISFGTSLPLRKSFSTLVLGVSVGKRGSEKNNLINENYINLHLGVTINDKWFIQSKYD